MPNEDNFRIRQAVLKALFDIQADSQECMEVALDAFDEAQYLLFNSTLLPIMGIGEDSFFLNEYLGDTTTILDFETLYDYDFDDYQFQEKARQEENPDYVVKPYRGSLYYTWARLQIAGVFHYASLSMAAGYLFAMIDELGFEKMDALIPHAYVKGKHHGKREGNCRIYDRRIDAGGMERQLEELRHRFYRYTSERYEALLNDFDEKALKAVYLFDRTQGNDPHMDFVFSDKTTLQSVRFRHFMQDCRASAGDSRDLDALIAQERQAVLTYLDQAYQDILDTFDPKLIRFHKKYKIVIADGAWKDLM